MAVSRENLIIDVICEIKRFERKQLRKFLSSRLRKNLRSLAKLLPVLNMLKTIDQNNIMGTTSLLNQS